MNFGDSRRRIGNCVILVSVISPSLHLRLTYFRVSPMGSTSLRRINNFWGSCICELSVRC